MRCGSSSTSTTAPAATRLIADIEGNLIRGASMGFAVSWGGERRSPAGRCVITRCRLLDIALLEKPAYTGSTIELRADRPRRPRSWL